MWKFFELGLDFERNSDQSRIASCSPLPQSRDVVSLLIFPILAHAVLVREKVIKI